MEGSRRIAAVAPSAGDAAAPAGPERLYSLDVLRGLAAFAVVFWHWRHFFFDGSRIGEFDPARLPMRSVFGLCYAEGWRAVDLFFCLSGFVFRWLYADAIAARRVSAREFAVLRFSRLYPLHAATLLVVAAGQIAFTAWGSGSLVYSVNDSYHFGLNVAFASSWGLEEGMSFNGPGWSVSVEVLLYAVFFLLCRMRLVATRHVVAILVATWFARWLGIPDAIGRGLVSFFAGCVAFSVFRAVERRRPSATVLTWMVIACAAAWILVPLNMSRHLLFDAFTGGTDVSLLIVAGHDIGRGALGRIEDYAAEQALYPFTIVVLALVERHRGTLGRRAAWLGDISYSSYLLHFPLQMLFLAVALAAGAPRDVFYSPVMLVAFFAVLLAASFASHRWFERPAQGWLRRRLLGR